MDMQELKDIIRLLKAEGLTEITVSDGDQRVTVKRLLQGTPVQQSQPVPPGEAPTQPISPELPERGDLHPKTSLSWLPGMSFKLEIRFASLKR